MNPKKRGLPCCRPSQIET